MKIKLFIALSLSTILMSNKGLAQLVYQQKTWQHSVSATIGINYSNGTDIQGLYTLRIKSSPFFISGGVTFGSEELAITSVTDASPYKELAKLQIIQLSGAYSLFDKISPTPINVTFFGGFINVNEKIDLRDGNNVSNNTVGNVVGTHFEWYCLRNLSLIVRQNLFFLYSSPFGKFRTNSSVGISINF